MCVCMQVAKNGGGVSTANQVAYHWAQNLGQNTHTLRESVCEREEGRGERERIKESE